MRNRGCSHPCNFRIRRIFDRGWGEIAVEYIWGSTGESVRGADGTLPELTHCSVHEFTTYGAETNSGLYVPPDPPFAGWRLRNPTDGRFCHVGLESFSAAQGHGWDRHKLAGPLVMPSLSGQWTIEALQSYRFHCTLCGCDADLDGPDTGPHIITRTFTATMREATGIRCRYEINKHGRTAWMEMDETGYVRDSADIGFGPAWLTAQCVSA